MITMARPIRPSPRITILALCMKLTKIEPKNTVRRYTTPIARTAPSAPERLSKIGAKVIPATMLIDESNSTRKVRFPIILFTVSISFFPMARESTELEPIPIKTAMPLLIRTKGDAAETALMADVPTICPT